MKGTMLVTMENAVTVRVIKIKKKHFGRRAVLVETRAANDEPTTQWLYPADTVNVRLDVTSIF